MPTLLSLKKSSNSHKSLIWTLYKIGFMRTATFLIKEEQLIILIQNLQKNKKKL